MWVQHLLTLGWCFVTVLYLLVLSKPLGLPNLTKVLTCLSLGNSNQTAPSFHARRSWTHKEHYLQSTAGSLLLFIPTSESSSPASPNHRDRLVPHTLQVRSAPNSLWGREQQNSGALLTPFWFGAAEVDHSLSISILLYRTQEHEEGVSSHKRRLARRAIIGTHPLSVQAECVVDSDMTVLESCRYPTMIPVATCSTRSRCTVTTVPLLTPHQRGMLHLLLWAMMRAYPLHSGALYAHLAFHLQLDDSIGLSARGDKQHLT